MKNLFLLGFFRCALLWIGDFTIATAPQNAISLHLSNRKAARALQECDVTLSAW